MLLKKWAQAFFNIFLPLVAFCIICTNSQLLLTQFFDVKLLNHSNGEILILKKKTMRGVTITMGNNVIFNCIALKLTESKFDVVEFNFTSIDVSRINHKQKTINCD